ncbi:hypothetical protein [Pseudomonas citri]|uniref:hypothetical protein n=1 Tax=Pseudomonas citri TaxID=2978349 RepID=UPI0021B6DF35|nr:hypothetical protein [Pseudomonas citri]
MSIQEEYCEIIDAEYKSIFKNLKEITTKEIEKANKTAIGARRLSPLEEVKSEQETTINLIKAKEIEYQARTKPAYSLHGQNPFFLLRELSLRRIRESTETSPPNAIVAYTAINNAYRSALELKRLSLQKEILAEKLGNLSIKVEQTATQAQPGQQHSALAVDEKLRIINQEKTSISSSSLVFC